MRQAPAHSTWDLKSNRLPTLRYCGCEKHSGPPARTRSRIGPERTSAVTNDPSSFRRKTRSSVRRDDVRALRVRAWGNHAAVRLVRHKRSEEHTSELQSRLHL